jgi:hypothetical protein
LTRKTPPLEDALIGFILLRARFATERLALAWRVEKPALRGIKFDQFRRYAQQRVAAGLLAGMERWVMKSLAFAPDRGPASRLPTRLVLGIPSRNAGQGRINAAGKRVRDADLRTAQRSGFFRDAAVFRLLLVTMPAMRVATSCPMAATFAVVMAFLPLVSRARMSTFFGVAVDASAVAGRTRIRTRRAAGHGKPMLAFRTDKVTIAFHGYSSPFDSHRQTLDQRLRNLAPRALDEPSEGRPRHIDLFRGFAMVQPFQIPQTKGFQLIPAQDNFAGIPEWDPGRFEHPHGRVCANPSALMRSSHC